jgi:hypothetical protein
MGNFMHSKILGLTGVALGALLAFSAPALADAVVLPTGSDASCGLGPTNNCLQFSDFTVFSLSLLQFQLDGNNQGPTSQDPYYAASSPGQLNDAIVIFTAPGGVSNPAGPIDQPYSSPNNVPAGALANFAMTPPDPSPSFTGDNIQMANSLTNNAATTVNQPAVPIGPDGSLPLWDINIDTLKTFLDGHSLDFYFNLNQTDAQGGTYLHTAQDLLAWMEVTLTSADGTQTRTFRLDGNNCTINGAGGTCLTDPLQTQITGVNDILETSADKWAYVHGTICAAGDGTVIFLGRCADAQLAGIDTTGAKDVDQNLGQNNASFAMYSNNLNDWLYDPLFTGGTLTVDARMAALNNGYEQLYILAGAVLPPEIVPEPLTITLFGAGLAGVGLLGRRRKKNSNG